MTDTKIEWTDVVWNPVTGCTKVSEGCRQLLGKHVVAGHESAGTAEAVVLRKSSAASAGAQNRRIGLALNSTPRIALALSRSMLGERIHNLQVLFSVVGLVAVRVMNLFRRAEPAAKHFLRNQAVLVNVAAAVRGGMFPLLDEHVAVGGDGATAAPVRVAFTGMHDAHVSE
jgi:hypothetical protein